MTNVNAHSHNSIENAFISEEEEELPPLVIIVPRRERAMENAVVCSSF